MAVETSVSIILWVMGIGTPAIVGYAIALTLKLVALRHNMNNLREKIDQNHKSLVDSMRRDNHEMIYYLKYFCREVSGKEPPPPLGPSE